jgi:hypothetical protein
MAAPPRLPRSRLRSRTDLSERLAPLTAQTSKGAKETKLAD